ncbi:MAG: PAS domain S-box protein, partial [Planctomycetales bacterium]|nr:PAS domain S-box protein [Planctomycetales bacterium]
GGTPCANVWSTVSVCYYAEGVQQQFPDDKMLANFGIESYLGIPLMSSNDQCIGLLALLHTSRIDDPTRAATLLQVLGARTSVEIDRVRAEQALRSSEEKLSLIAATMPQALYVFNLQTQQTEFTNREVGRDLGYSQAELDAMGPNMLGMLLHPEDAARLPKLLERWNTAQDREVLETEYRMRTAQGDHRWFLGRDTVLERQADGQVTKIIGTAQDITERKIAEAALRQSEERLLAVIRNAPDVAIQWYDARGKIILWNEASERIFGYSAQEAIGQTLFDRMLAPEDAEMFRQSRASILATGKPVGPVEFNFTRRDGSSGTCLSSAFRLPGQDGQWWVVCMDVDITQRKQAEEERRLFEAQIQQTQKLESLGVLAGGIAHDFNNLLTTVLGYSELALQLLPGDAPAAKYIDEAIKGVQNAAELTQQMLAYSGRGHLAIQPIDLSQLVADTSRLLEVSISKQCQLERELDPALPSCEGDPAQLRQVVMNLIINASEAMANRSGTIRLQTRPITVADQQVRSCHATEPLPAGEYVQLVVSDTGCGMDAETRERLFDPFFTTKFTGRGLGMAAVLGIVKRHGGAIVVDSEVERGTQFQIYLPATQDQPATQAPCETVATQWQGSGTILLADDDGSIRNLAKTMLQTMGFEVITASDGEEALSAFRENCHEITLAVLDVTMPKQTGSEVMQAIQQTRPDVPVVLVSGYDEQTAGDRFGPLRVSGFLQKPFRFDIFRDLLRRILG